MCLSKTFFISVVQLLSWVLLSATPWTATCQASLFFTISRSLLKLISIESVMPSHHLVLYCPLLPHLQSFPASGSFLMSQLFTSGGQNIRASALASVLQMNIQGLFPLGLTGLISLLSKGLSRVFSNTATWSINSSALSLLCGPTLTTVQTTGKKHSFDYMDLCWQCNLSAF